MSNINRRQNETEIDSPSEWKVRTRLQLDSWAPAVALLLVVVAFLGGWMTYTVFAVEEEPETEEVVTAEWRTNPGFGHSATVERPNPLYEVGDSVSRNSVYYTGISPSLNGVYTFEYTATDTGTLDVETEVDMVLRETGDSAVYWSQSQDLVRTEETGVEPGQTVRTEFSVDVPEAERRIDEIRSGLGANVGDEEVLLIVTTRVDGEVNGEDVNFGESQRIQVDIGSDTYSVELPDGAMEGRTFETTEMVEIEQEPDRARMAFSPLLLLISLGLLAGLIMAKRRDSLAPTERELLAMERMEFDEWISTGTVSDDILRNGKRSTVRVDSIEGMVDVGIDCGGRVIEDRDKGILSVIGEDVVYVYEYDEVLWKPVDREDRTVKEHDGNGAEDAETEEEEESEESKMFERLKGDD